ncbi:hypothetical protein IHN63_00140 [Deinococcus sp. 6YEL10]|uniref:hypothetical protein n=1 Tax=Deinococcus sp. 6YEL10 TaxID=2745870 RepID=UPI001E621BCB|nr:hypothetical protein [Deinococcus sp. 6YEL10]MCD0159707.1 hypothetical protein [Deinococcus sp. 6YEL10]
MSRIRIVTPSGTETVHEATYQSIHADGRRTVQISGGRTTFRRNLRTWWSAAIRNAQRKQSVHHPVWNVTRTRYLRAGPVGLGLTAQFDSAGRDTNWSAALHLPAISLTIRLSRPLLTRRAVSLHLPSFSIQVEGVMRSLNIWTFGLWNYPYGQGREWGVNLGQFNSRSLLLYASPEAPSQRRRVNLLWFMRR